MTRRRAAAAALVLAAAVATMGATATAAQAAGYDRLYCAWVFDTFNAKVNRNSPCTVPKNAIPGIHKVYVIRNNQIMITADRGPDIFSGPAYINIDRASQDLSVRPPQLPAAAAASLGTGKEIGPEADDGSEIDAGDEFSVISEN
ncbi:hypothetical protein [Streptomyces palmae]|uniref:Uncharacterized protein n=1 Tax=Streptomyces palmae TaxID=1701085 RepID=A0A4Z0HGK5_9ACTN|nr:hypothetical protein [Streptomyces palmae]TGB15570.1 hypothetical protein E4099_06680 [Streptomyces palmae]